MIPFVKAVLAADNPSLESTPFTGDAPTLIPECALGDGGADNLECVLELFTNISQILLGVVGSVLLAVFVYGGILYLFSQGEPGRIAKGQKALTGGVIGLMIVFGAFATISYGVQALRNDDEITSSEYVTCGSTDEQMAAANAQQCAPGAYFCSDGECCFEGRCEDGAPENTTSITPAP